MENKNSREYTYEILKDVFINETYSNITLNKLFSSTSINYLDKKYITELFYGTIKNKVYLEYILKQFTKYRIKKKIKILLMMSLYQIIYMDKTPDFATVNEAVKIAKKEEGINSSKFVNGLLRNFIRNFDKNNLKFKNKEEEFCIKNSCPISFFNILKSQYGEEIAKKIVLSFNYKSTNSIRVNNLKNSKKELISKLNLENVIVEESKICKDCLLVDKLNIESDLFKHGFYTIQDEASSLVALSLASDNINNYKILDTCAAPGGKTAHIAEKFINSEIVSCDIHNHKLELMKNNFDRLGFKNIKIQKQDATIFNEKFNEKFDIILCDVPCSGIGVIKNKPEIKYKITDEYIKEISKLQYSILENNSKYLKKNGIIIYSTCTIDKRENYENIDKFLKNNKNFVLEKIKLDSDVKVDKKGVINILPFEYNCDGFFIAKLRKVEN